MAQWDYTVHAKYYDNRPNYSLEAIRHLCNYVNAKKHDFIVADIGAGTGNLTILLKDHVEKIIAIEPNEAMRELGVKKTRSAHNVEWRVGTGENTGLPDGVIDWVTFGSSFNTTDRGKSLSESHRILKPSGFFTCMWNNRDLEDPVQKRVDEIIREFVPHYSHGTRREQQADVILASKLFNHVYYCEFPQRIAMPLTQYLEGWRSVRNEFWDVETPEGKHLLESILSKIHEELSEHPNLEITYVTKAWTAQRIE